MKHAASQQGWTPSQQQGRTPSQQGRTPSQLTAATPPVSTPFSNAAHTAFSPHGPRSSPQQFKKSPATNMSMMAQAHNAPMNFDSPSTAAAMGQLGLGGGLDMGLDGVGGLGGLGHLVGEDDKIKRLETILDILNVRMATSLLDCQRLTTVRRRRKASSVKQASNDSQAGSASKP
jgi:hypothetical protein